MADPGTALRNVTLDDKYDLSRDRVFITGTQAIIRLLLMQRERPPRRAQHRGFRVRVSRLSDRRPRPEPVPGEEVARAKHRVPARPQRGTGGDRGLGLPAGGDARRGQVRRRVRHVVRQGPRRRPLGDVFRHANMAGSSKHGGVLALMGDDHTAESSTVAHQSEFHFVDVMIPILNPAGVQEILDYGLYGYAMSRFAAPGSPSSA